MKIFGYIKNNDPSRWYHEGDIRLDYPEIKEEQTGDTFPILDGYEPLYEPATPEFDEKTQTVQEITPVKIDGKWQRQFTVRDYSPEELKAIAEEMASRPSNVTKKPGAKPNAV